MDASNLPAGIAYPELLDLRVGWWEDAMGMWAKEHPWIGSRQATEGSAELMCGTRIDRDQPKLNRKQGASLYSQLGNTDFK